jgi:hypothetical protein
MLFNAFSFFYIKVFDEEQAIVSNFDDEDLEPNGTAASGNAAVPRNFADEEDDGALDSIYG